MSCSAGQLLFWVHWAPAVLALCVQIEGPARFLCCSLRIFLRVCDLSFCLFIYIFRYMRTLRVLVCSGGPWHCTVWQLKTINLMLIDSWWAGDGLMQINEPSQRFPVWRRKSILFHSTWYSWWWQVRRECSANAVNNKPLGKSTESKRTVCPCVTCEGLQVVKLRVTPNRHATIILGSKKHSCLSPLYFWDYPGKVAYFDYN